MVKDGCILKKTQVEEKTDMQIVLKARSEGFQPTDLVSTTFFSFTKSLNFKDDEAGQPRYHVPDSGKRDEKSR